MEGKKITILIIIGITVAVLGVGLWFWSSKNVVSGDCDSQTPSGDATLFYSLTCPHCKNVEAFIAENKVKCRINLEMLEVSGSQTAAQKFFEIAKGCGMDQENAGVPLLYSEGKCYQGDSDIINLFKEKM